MSERDVLRFLVIDDDELSREVLALLLGDAGYEVNSAGSGEEALAVLDAGEAKPDVVLMDWQMPGVCGDELAQRLREVCGREMRLLAMSGSRPPNFELSMSGRFLLKPFSMEELNEALRSEAFRAVGESLVEKQEPSTGSRRAMGRPIRWESVSEALDDEVLDPKIYGGFEAMMGREPLQELYRHCLADAGKHVALMERAWEAVDDAGLRRCAHAMKGSLGMVGARELQRLCSALEESGIADDHVATLRELPDALHRLRRMLIARGVKTEEQYETQS